jgi:uncharacterized protein DUF1552
VKPLARRTVLRGAGGVAIALPFLDAMWPRRASAAALPKRLFVMVGQNGTVPSTWFPGGSEKQFTLASSMAPFESLKEHLIIPDGLTKMQRGTQDNTAHGRGMASALTGWSSKGGDGIADGASLDQVVARQIGSQTRIPSFMLGRVSNYHVFHDGPRQVHFPEPNVQKNFDRLFANFTPPASGGAAADPNAAADLARLRARKKSILDATIDQYTKVAALVGPSDRKRLEAHTEAIRKLELQIDAAGRGPEAATASCTEPAAAGQDTDYINNGTSNLDLAALAFACDLTRVAGYQWISHGTVFSWLGVTEKHHPLAHQTGSAGADAQLTKIVTWHSEQAAAFLTRLKSFPEGPGTVLDNTVFLWTWSVSVGSHGFGRGPFLLASGKFPLPAGGTLQTGRYLKYNGNPHTSLLQSVAALYGGPKMPVYPDWDKGPLAGLY